jgi:hypothetical protein
MVFRGWQALQYGDGIVSITVKIFIFPLNQIATNDD